MNETQVVAALLQFYKSQGVDLHYVLDDPVFASLSLQGKVAAIKAHAKEIVDGTSPGYSPLDRKMLISRAMRMGVQGGLAGATAGAALSAATRGFKYAPVVIGGLTGLGAGIASGFLERKQEINAKKSIRNQLQAVASNPTDANALGALSIRGIHTRQSGPAEEAYAILRDRANASIAPDALRARIGAHMDMVEAARRGPRPPMIAN